MKIYRSYVNPQVEESDLQLTIDNYTESLRNNGIGQYRCKTIISGQILEVEVYPLPKLKKGERAKPEKPSRPTQRTLNNNNARKYVTRIINANFGKRDMWATLDYRHELTPQDEEQAYNDIKNYIRCLKRYVKKHNLPDLKYIYVTEWVENTVTGELHAHHHIVMNFPDRDKAEKLWRKGFRPQTRRLKPDDFGLTGLGSYIAKAETKTKNRQGKKRYGTSQNLVEPTVRYADHKITRRDIATIAKDENKSQHFFEEQYASYNGAKYTMLNLKIKRSEYHGGTYIHVQMRCTGKAQKKGTKKC